MSAADFAVESVPFEYAIPMLTGWDLQYACADEHVKEVGVWIAEWSYVKDPAAPAGTLPYRLASVLRDKHDVPGYYRRHKVAILGLRRVAGGTPRARAPDLVPFSPSGNSEAAFCRLEERGRLRVTVRNQGDAAAPASRTTVTFGDIPVTRDTPGIPVGGSVDLLFDVPAGCFGPDCYFRIVVDSSNQVDELSMEGNNRANGRCIG